MNPFTYLAALAQGNPFGFSLIAIMALTVVGAMLTDGAPTQKEDQ